MKGTGWFLTIAVTACLLAFAQTGTAQGRRNKGHILVPQSSVARPADLGVKAHTHLLVMMPEVGHFTGTPQPSELPPFPGLFFETPASIACVYHLVQHARPGCNPDETAENPSGGSGAIAVIDAFDDPNAAHDLAAFSAQFGLPAADFQVVFAGGTRPPVDPTGGWELEESLDIEWAHAMAPKAKLFLVEANSNSFEDLLSATMLGANLVASSGGGEVSMSWGGGEFVEETLFDAIFTTPGVVYLASSGDGPGVIWPSASPNVVSAGGTTISRDADSGSFLLENSWQDTGGGPSQVESRPHFQDRVGHVVKNARGTPDISFDANPNTGVWVFDTNPFQGQVFSWFVVGGTSVSAPSLAGIINAAGNFAQSSEAENELIYKNMQKPFAFRDIAYGTCGLNIGDFAGPGWDFCTGVGSASGYHGK